MLTGLGLTWGCLVTLAASVSVDTKKLLRRDALPDFALKYAPHTYLQSDESYFPSDITTHLEHVKPEIDFTALADSVTLDDLNTYNSSVYLTAAGGRPSDHPAWITSDYGKPDNETGASGAPATIIAVDVDDDTTDVFYFYFYSYDHGGTVLEITFGDHVGDWEHVMIRFIKGSPHAIYFSQHSAGSAYYWSVPEFIGDRPVTYIAKGTHANYIKSGKQDYTFAGDILTDQTDAGYYWDVTQNYRGYWFDATSGKFSSAGGAGSGGKEQEGETAEWLQWEGHWGDEQYKDDYFGQYCIFGECHYVSGPTGPVDKNLGRTAMCQDEDGCEIFDDIDDLTEQI